MISAFKTKLVFYLTIYDFEWKLLKASLLSCENYYAIMSPVLCQVYSNCYCVLCLCMQMQADMWQCTGIDWDLVRIQLVAT